MPNLSRLRAPFGTANKPVADQRLEAIQGIQNCRVHGVEPHAFLKDLLERLPTMTNQDRLDQLTPLNWMRAHEKSLTQAA